MNTGRLRVALEAVEREVRETELERLEEEVVLAGESFASWKKRRKERFEDEVARLREEYERDVRDEHESGSGRRARLAAATRARDEALRVVEGYENRLRNEMLRSGLSAARLAEYLPERWRKKTGWYAVRKFLEGAGRG